MTNPFNFAQKARLLATAAPFAFVLAASPAFAQTAPTAEAQATAPAQAADDSADNDIVVTGSLFRRSDVQTAAPLTSITADQLEKRGLNTAQEAIQRLSANGAGALPNNFSAGGAFAAGASAVSLRGLTTSSTLVLFDGLRAAYYPLADDGTRNFVDLNTIPDAIIDRIDVLKEGASSTYGADAVAGVVNVILKKEIKGYHFNASAGISEKGDSAEQRFDGTVGFGDLNDQGFNVYVSGEYQKNDPLFSRDRGYPYNTSDFSKLCGTSRVTNTQTCRTNGIVNGVQFDGAYTGLGTTIVPIFRPYNAAGTAAIAGSRYQYAAGSGCGAFNLPTYNLTAAQLASAAGATAPLAGVCQQDTRALYNQISPEQERIGGSAHLTVRVGDSATAYATFNFYQSRVNYLSGSPRSFAVATSAVGAPVPTSVTTSQIILPQYVCAAGVGSLNAAGQTVSTGCTAANGTLNPSNPFAATGPARLVGLVSDVPFGSTQLSRTYRGAIGITGTFGGDWGYQADFTAMRVDLTSTTTGYPNLQHLLDAIAKGTYNFANPSLNTAAQREYVIPTAVGHFNSELYQGQASLTKGLFDLPGGAFQAAVGVAARHEAVNAPSRNPLGTNPLDRSALNAFGAVGKRDVESAFFELHAPIFDQLELNGSGRYDHYSSGQNNFSPKINAIIRPIKQIALFGTYSKGFRIGSFAESNGSPTTGFVTTDAPAAFQATHGNAGTAAAGSGYSLGLTTISNPALQPEKSTNLTLGATFEPVTWLTLKGSYYSIKKKGGITFPNYKPAVAAYFAAAPGTIAPGQTLTYPGGFTIVAGPQDVNFPTANPVPAFVAHTLDNAASIFVNGIDFSADVHLQIAPGVRFTSNLDATYIIKSQKVNSDGSVERYDGSLGPYQITSASGTPKWRGSIQSTLDINPVTLSATVYYTSGYNETAEDNGGLYNDSTGLSGVGTGTPATYRDNATPVVGRVKSFVNTDLTFSVRVNEKFRLYGNVLNVFNVSAPYDPTTYGGSNYNPAWASAGILGRYFRVGVKVDY